jgi:phosphoribosylanthranilate isomerase
VAKKIASDMLLFDAFSQNARGGTGESFDWELIKSAAVGRPFFLAGGITAENAAEAIRLTESEGIDVSSSVETEGYKDFDKMKRLIRAVRNIKD